MLDVTVLINFCESFLKLNNKKHSNRHFMARYCAFIFFIPFPHKHFISIFFPIYFCFLTMRKKSDHWSCSLLLLKVHSNIGKSFLHSPGAILPFACIAHFKAGRTFLQSSWNHLNFCFLLSLSGQTIWMHCDKDRINSIKRLQNIEQSFLKCPS